MKLLLNGTHTCFTTITLAVILRKKIEKMKKITIILSLLIQISFVFAQSNIKNELTTNHVNVAGTKISLIPPKGITKAQNFVGFQQDESGSSIMVMDIPGSFPEVSKAMTKENFLSNGVEIKSIEEYISNDKKGLFLSGEQNAYGKIFSKFIFVFETENETIMINGAFPNNLMEIGKEIKTSILSTFYDGNKKINPFDNVDFEIDTTGTNLIFAKSMANMLTYNTDGLLPTKSINDTSLIIGKALSNVDVQDKKLYAINRLKKMPFEIVKIENTNEITVDDVSGYEITAITKDKKTGLEEKVYQVILFSDNLYYILLGKTNNDFDKNVNVIKKIVRTFKRK